MIRGFLRGTSARIYRILGRRVRRGAGPSRRSRGGFMGRTGIDLFIEDGAYTTLSAAVAMLAVLTLLFSSATAIWSMSRAGDTQVTADAGALAGANVVSGYHTAATVIDASILSLGLVGFAAVGTGLVGLLIPGAHAEAAKTIATGTKIIKTRNEFAKSASKGLSKLEDALPYLVATRSTEVMAAQGSDDTAYVGTALAVPRTSASDFAALEGSQISTEVIESTSADLDRAAQELEKASKETSDANERAWRADCGDTGKNSSMWERAGKLAGLSGEANLRYESSISWHPKIGLERARAYYRERIKNDRPDNDSTAAQAAHAARMAFYGFALEELEDAQIIDNGSTVKSTIPLLPREPDDLPKCDLYDRRDWPVSRNGGTMFLHYGVECPGYQKGVAAGFASVGDYDGKPLCEECGFGCDLLGRAPMGSSYLKHGFEYHLRVYTEAVEDWVDCRNKELELERQCEDDASRAGDAFSDAIKTLSGSRPRIAPPGRNGVVAFAVSGEASSPDELTSSFNDRAALGSRGAISAAVLAPDEQTAENNVLSRFFSTLADRSDAGGVPGLLNDVMGLWGQLLVGYGNIQGSLDALMDDLLGDLGGGVVGGIASWFRGTISGIVSGLGLQPADLRLRKPVLTDTANVIKSPDADLGSLSDVQESLRSIPLGATDPKEIADAMQYEIERTLNGTTFTLAEIPLPGGGSIPLTVGLPTLAGAFEGEP